MRSAELISIVGATPDPRRPGTNLTLEQQVKWVALNTAGNLCYLNSKSQNALRNKKSTLMHRFHPLPLEPAEIDGGIAHECCIGGSSYPSPH